ncbi:unnamed protein product [Symbiodinium sp. CCMP2592]|nr:unnamed protein product [Symbiodinium sp. CCMP2592]
MVEHFAREQSAGKLERDDSHVVLTEAGALNVRSVRKWSGYRPVSPRPDDEALLVEGAEQASRLPDASPTEELANAEIPDYEPSDVEAAPSAASALPQQAASPAPAANDGSGEGGQKRDSAGSSASAAAAQQPPAAKSRTEPKKAPRLGAPTEREVWQHIAALADPPLTNHQGERDAWVGQVTDLLDRMLDPKQVEQARKEQLRKLWDRGAFTPVLRSEVPRGAQLFRAKWVDKCDKGSSATQRGVGLDIVAAFLIGKDRGAAEGRPVYMHAPVEWRELFDQWVLEQPAKDQQWYRDHFRDFVFRVDGNLYGRRTAGSVYRDELEEVLTGKCSIPADYAMHVQLPPAVLFWLQRPPVEMARARNEASAKDIKKVLKGNGFADAPKPDQYMNLSLDEVVAEYKVLILAVLKETSRPTVKVLLAGCMSLFPESSRELCKPWCEKLVNAVCHCRSKRSCTSGKKLPPAVREVVMFLKGMGGSVAREVSRSSFSSSASKPAASPRPSPSSVAPATRSSKEQIFTQYGLEAPVSDPGAEVEETGLSPAHVQEVFSSQEVMSPTQEAPPTAALPVEDKTSGGDGSAEYQEYFDSARLCMVRAYPSGALVMATMQKGEDGFQKALFPGSAEAVSTEIPNLRIQRMKRPAARVMKKPAAKKRPAAAPTTASASASSASLEENEDSGMEPQPSVAEEQPENVAAAQQDRVGRRTYTIMYYKAPRHKKAIRQKQAPFSQLFQFGRKGVPVWQMDRIAKACVQKLESGELEEADAEDWCKSRLAQPVAMATTGTSYYSGGGSGGGGWGSGGWGSGGWGGGGGRDDKSYWEPWKDDEPDEDPDDEPEYDLRYCQFCKSYGYIRKDGCVNKKCKPDYTPKEFDDIHGIGQAMACSLALGLSYVKTKAAGCPKGKWWGETEAAVDPEKRRRQAEAAEARSQAAAPASPTGAWIVLSYGPVAPAAGNDQGEPHAGDNQEKEKGEKGGDPADKFCCGCGGYDLSSLAAKVAWRPCSSVALGKMRPSAVPCGTDEEEVPRRTKSAAGEPVKTEPLSPQKPKETLGMAKAEVAGLLTSLKYQIKAKKMTEKHREQANDILLKYQQSGVHGKKEILQKLQTSGLRDLSWFAEMQSEYQTQSVDKESTTKGYFNRSQILKMNGLDPSNMDEAVAADTLKDLIADCEAEFGSDLGRLVEKFDNPDLEVPANEEAWNKAYSACKAAKSKLGKVADELEEQHAKLVAHGPQAEADEVGPKIETLRGFLKTLRFKISEWMNMSEGCMEAKLPELTQLSEEATSHLAAATAYNKKLKSQNCSLGVASLCCRAFRFRWARILGWHSYEGCAKGVKDLAQAKQGSNTARNLLRRNLRRTPWPPPYECQVRGKNPRTGKEDLYTLAFMLPHEVLHVLLESNDVSEIRNQQARIPNLQEQLQEHGNDVLLLGLWLDGVPFSSDRSQTLQCATLSLPGLTDAGDFRFPLTGFPKFFQMPEATWDDVTAIIAWSMRCCYTGFFPSFRHDESRFLGNDSWRKRRASQPLGCRAVLAEVRADWSAYQEVLRLPGWTGNGPICWFCQATLQDLHDVDESSSWRSSRLSHYQFLARQISEGKNLSPLFSCPCFSVQKCCIDWLHCMDLGCAADYMGGLFHMVVQTKLPERSVHDRCKNLFGDIQNYYRRNLSQSRMSTLTPLMLKGKNKKWPKLRAKAGEARDLIGFAKECAERHMGNSDFERTVRQTAKHLHSCYEFLSERHWDAEKFHKTKPKMHLLLELGRQKRRPSETWTYRDEGFGCQHWPELQTCTDAEKQPDYDFQRGVKDPCVYLDRRSGLILLHHDDIRVAGPKAAVLKFTEVDLPTHCEITVGELEEPGTAVEVLGRTKVRTEDSILTLPDSKHAENVCEQLGIGPKDKGTVPSRPLDLTKVEELSAGDAARFRSAVGSAIYLSADRRDIQFAVKELARRMQNPQGLRLARCGNPRAIPAGDPVYSDSDWAGCPETRRSTDNIVACLGGAVIQTSCQTQPGLPATSSGDAEIRGVSRAAREAVFLRELAEKDFAPACGLPRLWADSAASIGAAKRIGPGSKLRHLEVAEFFVQGALRAKLFELRKVKGTENPANFATKHSKTGPEVRQSLPSMGMVDLDAVAGATEALAQKGTIKSIQAQGHDFAELVLGFAALGFLAFLWMLWGLVSWLCRCRRDRQEPELEDEIEHHAERAEEPPRAAQRATEVWLGPEAPQEAQEERREQQPRGAQDPQNTEFLWTGFAFQVATGRVVRRYHGQQRGCPFMEGATIRHRVCLHCRNGHQSTKPGSAVNNSRHWEPPP